IRIDELTLRSVRPDELDLRIACSKGTYIRVLAEDIGAALGCGAALKALRRTRVGRLTIDDATELAALEGMTSDERAALLLPVDAAVADLPEVTLNDVQAVRIGHGQPVEIPERRIGSGALRLYAGSSG